MSVFGRFSRATRGVHHHHTTTHVTTHVATPVAALDPALIQAAADLLAARVEYAKVVDFDNDLVYAVDAFLLSLLHPRFYVRTAG